MMIASSLKRIAFNYSNFTNSLRRFNEFYPKNKSFLKKNKNVNEADQTITPPIKEETPSSNQQMAIPPSNPDQPRQIYVYHDHPATDIIKSSNSFYRKSLPDEELKYIIEGEENQIALVDIYPGKHIVSESARFLYMTDGVELTTTTGKSGWSGSFQRLFTGSSVFLTEFRYNFDKGFGRIGFSENFPSKIIPIRLNEYGGEIICQKKAFVCGTPDINIEISFTKKFSTGFFGGEGWVLQKITGNGTCLVQAGGAIIKRKLREGERIKVSPGNLVCMEKTVLFDIEYVGSMKNIFGAGSLFYTVLTGPGDIFLQTMSFDNLMGEIVSRVPTRSGSTASGAVFSYLTKSGDSNNNN